jgi:hypothetical protein
MKKIIFLFLLINPLLSFSMQNIIPAIETPGAEGTLNDNKLYAGIRWQFGVKASFNAILGLKSTHTSSGGNVTGGDLNVGIPIDKEHFRDVKLKAEYVNGNTTGQGNLGVGYIFGRDKFLGTIGYSLPYVKLGTDYIIKDGFEPYLQINTLDKYNKPSSSASTYSCPPNYTASLSSLTNVCTRDIPILNIISPPDIFSSN